MTKRLIIIQLTLFFSFLTSMAQQDPEPEDGKEFMLGDVETALKIIPVSIIQNLKFYDQQSDQSRITGIDDGNKETVLDFSIKKGMNRGYMTYQHRARKNQSYFLVFRK